MRRLLGILLCLPSIGWCATSVTMDGPMTDNNATIGVAGSTRSYNLNMDDHNVDYASVQVLYASGTYSNATFNDGTASSATIKVVTASALSTATATGSFTVASTTACYGTPSTATIAVSSAIAGTVVMTTGPPGGFNFTVGSFATSTDTAVSLLSYVNKSSYSFNLAASINTSSTVVTLTSISSAAASNVWVINSSTPTGLSTAAFSGGTDPVTVSLGGYGFKAGTDFVIGATTGATADNLAAQMNVVIGTNSTPNLVISTDSWGNLGVIYTTASATGTQGNYPLTTTNSLAISTSGATMTGGQNNAVLCINGTCLKANTNWYPAATAAATADSLYGAINSSFTIVLATAGFGNAGVIYTTSTAVGLQSVIGYSITSSSNPALQINPLISSSAVTGASTGQMQGGTTSSYVLNGQTVTIPGHGFPNAFRVNIDSTTGNQPILYSTAPIGTATTLAFGTSIYTIPIDANTLGFSLTSTGAVAGLPAGGIYFVSSRTLTTADVWTLVVSTAAGPASYAFYESNDGTNFWTAPGVSSTTILDGNAYIYPSTFTFVDFGNVDAKWLQLRVAPPTVAGAISVKALVHGEKR